MFDTSSVTDMNRMFMNCSSLTTLKIPKFNISNVTDGTYAFAVSTKSITITVPDTTVRQFVIDNSYNWLKTSNFVIA